MTPRLPTAETLVSLRGRPPTSAADYAAHFWRHDPGAFARPLETDVVASAYVSWGRWVVECPLGCGNGAQNAVWTDQRYWCLGCGRGPFAVVWPGPALLGAIEELLLLRPRWPNRSWLPSETVDDLRLENRQFGLTESSRL